MEKQRCCSSELNLQTGKSNLNRQTLFLNHSQTPTCYYCEPVSAKQPLRAHGEPQAQPALVTHNYQYTGKPDVYAKQVRFYQENCDRLAEVSLSLQKAVIFQKLHILRDLKRL